MAQKINIGDILKLPAGKANYIGQKIVQEVQKDFKEGLFQNNQSGLQYISAQYKKYKSNAMRRFTSGGKLKDFDPSHDYMGKRLYGKKKPTTRGRRISGMYAKAIESTNTAYVDMTLTGQLKKGLRIKGYSNGVWKFGYDPKDADKIEGNRKYGREVVGLNDKNQELFKGLLLGVFEEGIRAQLKDVVIKVNL